MRRWLVAVGVVGLLAGCTSTSTAIGGATPPPSEQSSSAPTVPMPTDALLSAAGDRVVWALVSSGQYLFRSEDQGNSWTSRRLPPRQGGGGPKSITFVDGLHGWALYPGLPETPCNGAGAEVWMTSDGAGSWEQVASVDRQHPAATGIGYGQRKEGIWFVDSTHGFVGAWDQNHRPTICRTLDGGATWSGATLPDPPDFVSQPGGYTLRVLQVKGFGGTLLSTASAGNGVEFVFSSSDQGASWKYVASIYKAFVDVALVSRSHWIIIGNDRTGRETLDAGASWHTWASDYEDAAPVASQFVFANEYVGYGTVRGDVHRTTDGGAHWTLIKTSWP